MRIGWVKELPYQPIKYSINLEDERVRHLADSLNKVGYLSEPSRELNSLN